jgi:hypothetical protein
MANRFWVGGSGTWNDTNTDNWSTTSGGAGGASIPTSSDNAFFDANSGGGDIVVAAGATADFITAFPFNGSFTFVDHWNGGVETGGIFIRGEWQINIPANVNVKMAYVEIQGWTGTIKPTITVNGVFSISNQLIVNDSNTVYTEVIFNGNGFYDMGGASFTYVFMRRQNYVDAKFVFDKSLYTELFVIQDGLETTIREISKTNNNTFDFLFNEDNFTIENFKIKGGFLSGMKSGITTRAITLTNTDIRNATIQDLHVQPEPITVRNCIDLGNNDNIIFVDVPLNLPTNPTSLVNLQTNPSVIINENTVLTNVTNI